MGYILLVLPTSIWRVFLFSEIFSILEENAKKNTGCCRNPDGNISSQGAGICAGCLFHHCCHLISLPQIAHLRNSSFISLFQLMRNVICIFSSVQSLSRVRLFATPWTAAHQASLSINNSQSLPKLISIESVMPSSHLILCCPLCLLPPIPPSIRVFSNESTLRMRWPKYWFF